MQALLGYNRKLAWVVFPALSWACLGLAFAMGMGFHGPPPFALALGPPPGGAVIPGRLLALDETAAGLTLRMGVPDFDLERARDWQARQPEPLKNITVEFTELQPLPPEAQPEPEIHLLNSAEELRQLTAKRHVLLTRDYIVMILPFETRLLPRGEDAEQRLQQLIQEHRQRHPGDGWDKRGRGGDGSRRDRLEHWREFRRERKGASPPPPSPEPEPGG
jgi:hypothetical protein